RLCDDSTRATSITLLPATLTSCVSKPTKLKTRVASGAVSRLYLPLESVVVPTVVPLTMILTPGMGEPSAADVTCPVTMNCCNRLGVSKPVANDTFHAKIRASNVILWVECFMVRNFFAAGLEKGNMYDLLKVDSFLSKIQTREEDFF